MKDSTLITIALGMLIGAVGVSMYKPAQNVVKKGTQAVKEGAKDIVKKIKDSDE